MSGAGSGWHRATPRGDMETFEQFFGRLTGVGGWVGDFDVGWGLAGVLLSRGP